MEEEWNKGDNKEEGEEEPVENNENKQKSKQQRITVTKHSIDRAITNTCHNIDPKLRKLEEELNKGDNEEEGYGEPAKNNDNKQKSKKQSTKSNKKKRRPHHGQRNGPLLAWSTNQKEARARGGTSFTKGTQFNQKTTPGQMGRRSGKRTKTREDKSNNSEEAVEHNHTFFSLG